MQTFLPLPSFKDSARVLDYRRLGKQRVEVLQLLVASQTPSGWANHPVARMWENHEEALIAYGVAICDQWIYEGYNDTCREKILAFSVRKTPPTQEDVILPRWFGRESFHASHRGNLLRKDFLYYSRYGWTDSPLLPYEWPNS